MASRLPFSIPAIAFLFVLASATEQVDFGYSGSKGPDKWGSLSSDFSACSNGKNQSPVNIVKKETVKNDNLKPLQRDYRPANATLINNGFGIGIRYDGKVGVLLVDGKQYTFKQMHWHSPSEHLIEGVQYPVELHLVHQAADGSVSIVAILFQYDDEEDDSEDPFLEKIKEHLSELTKEKCESSEEAQIFLGKLDTKHIKRNTRKYYRYNGSLTSPPCTENIIWNILGKVRSISKDQVKALKAPLASDYQKNARPVQPLNGRKIELYSEVTTD